MTRARMLLALGLTLLGGTLALPLAAQSASPPTAAPPDGMISIRLDGVDQAMYRPASALPRTTRVRIDPVAVDFSNLWEPRAFGRFGLSAAEVKDIGRQIATQTRSAFAAALQKAGYAVADDSGGGELRLRLHIFDVYLNAPQRAGADPRQIFVYETGEMSLELELLHVGNGEPVVRMRDRHRDQGTGQLVTANEISNRTAVRQGLERWATGFVRLLEETR